MGSGEQSPLLGMSSPSTMAPPNFLAGSRNVIKGGEGRRRRPWLGPTAAADRDAFYFDEVTERHGIES
jgi:hypothetical protein